MPDRSPKFDALAIVLAAVTLLLVLALGTYDRYDPPSQLVWPPNAEVRNAAGRVGATVAHTLLEMMGVGAYYLVGSLGVLAGFVGMRRTIDQPVLRTVGWALSLVGVSTLGALALKGWSPGPIIGAGGYLGAMGRAWLESNFATAGAFLFALSVLLAGLLLCTDYFVFRAAAAATAVSGTTLGATLRTASQLGAHAVRSARRHKRTDLDAYDGARGLTAAPLAPTRPDEDEEDEEVESDEEAPARPLKVRTPKSTAKAAVVEEEEVDESEAEEAVDEEEAIEASAIAIRTPTDKKAKAKQKSEREQIIDELEAAANETPVDAEYELPPLDLLLPADDVSYEEHEKEVRRKAKILEKTFQDFGFNVKVVEIETGPVIAQYEVELEAGLRLAKITNLADDLAIALRVPSVRIVAPIPGKNTVGIEVPNEHRQLVRLREVIEETDGRARRMKIPIYLGKDVAGNPLVIDLTALPHLLIAGRTGTGKSVCLNTIIVSMLMSRGPDEVRMLMIDPKMVELSGYRKLPHLMHPVVTDMKKAEAILAWAVDKMEERYALLARAGVRHVSVYNQLSEEELRDRIQPENDDEWRQVPRQLPFIVIVADEIADLMMTSGKEVETHIIRLAQKSRAVGIHLILATQKPTVDVITGLIKSNLPARIAFQVASRTDSRVVLDEMGADKLLGNGDMLFLSPGTSQLLRGQGTYLSDDEITRVVDFVGTDDQQFATELMQLKATDEEEATGPGGALKNRDDLYEAAVDIVVRERRGSVSLLQRCLGIGYGRAARLIDFMAEDGIVGQYNGSQAREVAISVEEWEAMTKGEAATAPPTPPAPRSNRITPVSDEVEEDDAPWEEEAEEEWEEGDEYEEEEYEEEEEEENLRADSA